MNQFGNFGGGVARGGRLGQAGAGATTMVMPFFDWNGPFNAQQAQGVKGAVAYYPARMSDHDMKKGDMKHGKKGAEKRGGNTFWPLQGPTRAETHPAPYGFMGPLPYNLRGAKAGR